MVYVLFTKFISILDNAMCRCMYMGKKEERKKGEEQTERKRDQPDCRLFLIMDPQTIERY